MRILLTLLGKETRALFSSSIAYVVIAVFLLLMGYTFTAFLFLNRAATLVHIFFQAAVLFLLVVPVLTMRQFAEERKTGTLELLLTASVREIRSERADLETLFLQLTHTEAPACASS